MIFLPHTNTVILLEPYCGTVTEPGLPVAIRANFLIMVFCKLSFKTVFISSVKFEEICSTVICATREV